MRPVNLLLARAAITIVATALFFIVRPDIAGATAVRWRQHVVSRFTTNSYVGSHAVRKLHLGAGGVNLPGWLNTDIEPKPGQAYLDITERFPFDDKTFRLVFSEHLIEHVPYADGLTMLKETYRVLEPGGRMRLHTPNLDKYIALFGPNRTEEMKRFLRLKNLTFMVPETADPETYVLNFEMRQWGHQFLYTPKLMRARLQEAGFVNIAEVDLATSTEPGLNGIASRITGPLSYTDNYETMAFEAVKF
jgi:predicted SAM-dependent methyltransferase